MPRTRLVTVAAAVVLAPVMLLTAGLVLDDAGAPDSSAPPAAPEVVQVGDTLSGDTAGGTGLTASITALQQRLAGLPGDYTSWSALGFGYVAQARATADPSYYPQAEQAFARSLQERVEGNSEALAGQAALANARHEFAAGRDLAQRAVDMNPYDSTAQGILSDALGELGEYDRALEVLQRAVDLRPGVPSFTRVSHSYELRGDATGARIALERALAISTAPADTAYSQYYLAELAFNAGDYDTAVQHLAEGSRVDPDNVPLLALRARVSAARGDTAAALADYAQVVQRLPQPTYLVEYGELLDSLGRTADAQAQYRVADATSALADAGGVVPDIEIALYEADHGDPAKALRTARGQYETRRSVQVEDALAWALHVNGQHQEALEHAVAAQQLGTRSASFDYHRGMIQRELGMTEAARGSLTSALATNPGFSPLHAPLARAALAKLDAAS